jgi:protein-L-isoaspartate(D-aspartate) O-methyltransferase
MTCDPVQSARRWFAQEVRYSARVQSAAVVEAFATVPREHFSGPGPWRILSPMGGSDYWTTEDAAPQHLYHDVLVAIDETRRLNNGQPSLWACLYDQLNLARGEHVVHIGVGAGYYTAILAEIVGAGGKVTAVEIDPALAERSRVNLAFAWPQAKVINSDGFAFRPEQPADVIIVNASVSHLSVAWLDSLAPENGRLLVPLTTANWFGAFLMITRQGVDTRRCTAQFVSQTGIIPCVGGREADAEAKLEAALKRSSFSAIQSLRRAPEEPDDTCWLAGGGWWLSSAPASTPPPLPAANVAG